jgi:hypothetical protein
MKEIFLGNTEYYGDGSVTQPTSKSSIITMDEHALYMSTFDVKPDGGSNPETTKKIDLLVYNRVNSNGKIISSIVYIATPVLSDDTTSFMYRPRFMYKNSLFEQAIDIPAGTTDFSYFNMIRQFETDRPEFLAKQTKDLAINTLPAAIVMSTYPMFDGWYTLLSIGIVVNPTNDELVKVKAGQFVILNSTYNSSGDVQIALVDSPHQSVATDWHALKEFEVGGDSVDADLGSKMRVLLDDKRLTSPDSDWYPLYAKQEFFVKRDFNKVYKKLMHNYIAQYGMKYGESFKQMRVKDRIITTSALNNNFVEAQLFLQSTEYIILEYTEI